MNTILTKIKHTFLTKPSNAFLLFLTGFFFIQVMLSNILHTIHPHGGWVTSLGTLTTRSILMTSLAVLSICLIALWRSTETTKKSEVKLGLSPDMFASV